MSHRVSVLVPVLIVSGLAGLARADHRPVRVGAIVDETTVDTAERRANAAAIQRTISRMAARQRIASTVRSVDVAVVSLTEEPSEDRIIISAEVRVTISGGRGSHLTVLAGGARVEAPRATYHAHTRELRDDALGGAVEAVVGKTRRTAAARRAPRSRR